MATSSPGYRLGHIGWYVKTYVWLLRSPTRNTLALSDELSAGEARWFLGISMGLYGLVFLLFLMKQGFSVNIPLAAAVYYALILILATSLPVFYHLAQRRSKVYRSFTEFFSLASVQLGLCIPIDGLLQLPELWQVRVGSGRPSFGGLEWVFLTSLLVTIVAILGLVYAVRVWKRFWALPGRTVLSYLMLSSTLGGVAGIVVLFPLLSIASSPAPSIFPPLTSQSPTSEGSPIPTASGPSLTATNPQSAFSELSSALVEANIAQGARQSLEMDLDIRVATPAFCSSSETALVMADQVIGQVIESSERAQQAAIAIVVPESARNVAHELATAMGHSINWGTSVQNWLTTTYKAWYRSGCQVGPAQASINSDWARFKLMSSLAENDLKRAEVHLREA